MKILVTWIGPWLDKGQAAMLLSMTEALKKRIPGVQITALTSFCPPQEIDIIKYGEYGIKVLPGLFPTSNRLIHKLESTNTKFKLTRIAIGLPFFLIMMIKNILWLLLYRYLHFNVRVLIKNNQEPINEYIDSDWVIFCGGQNIYGINPQIFIATYQIILGKLLYKPIMIYANSLGSFKQKTVRPFIRWLLNKVDLITTREEISKVILDEIGVSTPVFATTDTAFSLSSVSRKDSERFLEKETGITKDKLMIGITAILWHFPDRNVPNDRAYENYTTAMAGAIDYMINKLNAYVIFFPQTGNITTHRDDKRAARIIFTKIENKSRVVILTDDYSPEQLKGMYGCMSLFIGTRFHSCIFALSMNVPTIAIEYEGHKASGIMEMLGLENYVCDIYSITASTLETKIDDLWSEKDAIRSKLKEKIIVIQDKEKENVELAIEYMGSPRKYQE